MWKEVIGLYGGVIGGKEGIEILERMESVWVFGDGNMGGMVRGRIGGVVVGWGSEWGKWK